MGGTVWEGRPAIRISVSNWQTTDEDVDRTLDGLRRPARRAVERAFEPTPEQTLEPARDLDQRVDVDPRLARRHARAARRDPRSRRSLSRAARTGSRRARRPTRRAPSRRPSSAAQAPRVARVARVVQMRADRPAEDRDPLDEPLHAARRRDADRVRQDELVRVVEPLAQVGDDRRIDLALERTTPRARDRDRRRHVAAATIARTRSTASSSVALPLRWLNFSVAASVQLTRSRLARANRSYPRSFSTSPDSSAPPRYGAATTSSAPAICGTRSSRTNETASIRGTPRSREARDELGANGRRQRRRARSAARRAARRRRS